MSQSSYAIGFKPADEQWKNMKAAWDACEKAGIPVPLQVLNFFSGENPGDKLGMEISLKPVKSSADARDFYDLEVADLVKMGIKTVRFVNSF